MKVKKKNRKRSILQKLKTENTAATHGKFCHLVATTLLTHCVQEIIVMCKRHQWVPQLSQPLFNKSCDCVDGIILQAHQMRV